MSSRWDLYCKTCGEEAGLEINRGKSFLLQILNESEKLVELGELMTSLLEFDIDISHYRIDIPLLDLIQWLKIHSGHKVLPLDEYGNSSKYPNEIENK